MTAETIDIQALLRPISEDKTAGVDLREGGEANTRYHLLKDARAEARNAERQMGQEIDATAISSHWQSVLEMSQDILKNDSKDLEVTAWLVEALLRKHQIAGLRDGFLIIQGLLENYWDEIFPMPDEDGIEVRVSPLGGLNGYDNEGTLIIPISAINVTNASSMENYALWQYQQALEIDALNDPAAQQKRFESGGTELTDVRAAFSDTPAEFYQNLQEDLQTCFDTFLAINDFLDEKCGHLAPPSSYIKRALINVQDHLKFLLQGSEIAILNTDMTDDDAETNEQTEETVTIKASGPIESRQQALKTLLDVANYFQNKEPHSPLPYVLKRAVRWGNLPLPELLKELIDAKDARDSVFSLTGIEGDDEPEVTN